LFKIIHFLKDFFFVLFLYYYYYYYYYIIHHDNRLFVTLFKSFA